MTNPTRHLAAQAFVQSASRFATVQETRSFLRERLGRRPPASKSEALALLASLIEGDAAWPFAEFLDRIRFARLRRWCRAVLAMRMRSKGYAVYALAAHYSRLAGQPFAGSSGKEPPKREPRRPASSAGASAVDVERARLRDRLRKLDALIADAAATPGERAAAQHARATVQRKLDELNANPSDRPLAVAACIACGAHNRLPRARLVLRPRLRKVRRRSVPLRGGLEP